MEKPFTQPAEWKFIEDLHKPLELHLQWKKPENQIEPEIICSFDDPEDLLKSAVDSLKNFMREAIPFVCPVEIKLVKKG